MLNSRFFQHSILLVAAFVLWLAFYPGTFTYDSLQQYAQAQSWNFNDWHPPLMAVTLGVILKLGGNVGLLTLFVCILGITGLRTSLAAQPEWPETVAAFVILSPLTPLAIYLVTFWKDSWLIVAAVWLVALLKRQAQQPTRNRRILIILIAALLPSIRHNAIAMLPAAGICLWCIEDSLPKLQRVGVAVLPLLLAGVISLLWPALGIRRTYVGDAVKIHELATLCRQWPEKCTEETVGLLQIATLDPSVEDHQYPSAEPVLSGRSAFEPYSALSVEYQRAWKNHPLLIARIKLSHFAQMFSWQTKYPYNFSIGPNQFGLQYSEALSLPRRAIISATSKPARFPFLFYNHLIWFVLAHILIIRNLLCRRWKPASLVLLPLAYYYSYLLASTVTDYRLMYPATVLTQIAFASLLLARYGNSASAELPAVTAAD